MIPSVVDTHGDLRLRIEEGIKVKAAVLPDAHENILAGNQLREHGIGSTVLDGWMGFRSCIRTGNGAGYVWTIEDGEQKAKKKQRRKKARERMSEKRVTWSYAVRGAI